MNISILMGILPPGSVERGLGRGEGEEGRGEVGKYTGRSEEGREGGVTFHLVFKLCYLINMFSLVHAINMSSLPCTCNFDLQTFSMLGLTTNSHSPFGVVFD